MNGPSLALHAPHAGPRMAALGPAAVIATALAATGGAACWGWLLFYGSTEPGVDGVVCALPALVAAALGLTSQSDREQYIARVLAAALMLPILLMMWATSQELGVSQLATGLSVGGFFVLHGLGFALLIWQLAALTTRIEPQVVAPIDAAQLASRLHTLLKQSTAWSFGRGDSPQQWVLASRGPDAEKRFHRVLLNVSHERREVQVRERLGAQGAVPQDADEASMRSIGDDWHETLQPQARRVWSRMAQTTMIKPDALAAVRLQMVGGEVVAEPGVVAAAEESKALLTLVAAVVTRSGYAWRPVMTLRG